MRQEPAQFWRGKAAFVLGTALAGPAMAQTAPGSPPPTTTPFPPAVAAPPAAGGSGLEITVTAKRLDEARGSIQPSLGASRYDFTPGAIDALPQGQLTPIDKVLLRAPGVAQDSFGQVHVRGDHANLQYRLDGVQLPEGLSLFSNALATQYASRMSLITGALPAQYGFRQAGVVDLTLKSGSSDPGAEASATAGSRSYYQPSLSYGGRSGRIDYFLTGQFLHNGVGIENPTSSDNPIHDSTDQWHALAKITGILDEDTRVSFIGGGSHARFEIPNNPGQTPQFAVNGSTAFSSSLLDQLQWEDTYFGILSLQKHHGNADFQLSAFSRWSVLDYQPDPVGDLMFNGIAPWANRTDLATGLQFDGSWKATPSHTLRAGFLVQRERATSLTSAQVLPTDGAGVPTSDQPSGIAFGSDLVGWTYGVYLQDEWKVSPTVTVNYGLRFDAIDGATRENQLSPRVNVVWQPNDILTAHAGYARYFTPPPLAQVNNAAIAATAGTTAAPAVTRNDPVKAERAHYFDAGFEVRPGPGLKFGFDAYYKIARNLLDEGQFGSPIVLTSFNYANAQVKGVELTGSYDSGPWSLYGNVAWSDARGTDIDSAQFNFAPDELAYIAQHSIYLDHSQSVTGSAGVSYTFNPDSEWATRLSGDVLVGTGLRKTVVTPNDASLPTYAVVNLSLAQRLPIKGTRGATVRLDVLNLFDHVYQLRDGTGVGVGAPQFGLRRTVLMTLSQKF
ncbi:TonB-dependent receptor [Enhydrobacter sp.]|jgi:outer membrane receptor protein involved in Fe transport|uniref:TonB-dependent receptor n=1 Tax=Enhydrobacter sp. TaxID=1894999 RepID=UPI00260693BC|nr:TonB-dependent receptor [Enhydrobacter sp.]WIM11864.1 MAG: Zinc-regulated outer membrane receptor [Enhydrobacter sp.]